MSTQKTYAERMAENANKPMPSPAAQQHPAKRAAAPPKTAPASTAAATATGAAADAPAKGNNNAASAAAGKKSAPSAAAAGSSSASATPVKTSAPASSASSSKPAAAAAANNSKPAAGNNTSKPASKIPAAPKPLAKPESKGDADDAHSTIVIVAPKARQHGFAVVKSVTSGDSVVLQGTATTPGGAAPEKRVSISGISAPKFSLSSKNKDEPFAFHAREFLREKLLGQSVQFDVNYSTPSGYEYADLTLKSTGESVAELIVGAGWAKVQVGKDGSVHSEKKNLEELQKDAESAHIGLFQKGVKPDDVTRVVDYEPNVEALFAKYKGQRLPAIVDKVIEGSMLRLELLTSDKSVKAPHHAMITLHLAGVQSPHMPLPLSVRKAQWEKKMEKSPNLKEPCPKTELPPSPFAKEAHDFVELRLLQRTVNVILVGTDKSGNLYGHVEFVKGDIAAKLVENGLAKTVAWTLNLLPASEQKTLTAAETHAKKVRAGEWSLFKGDPFAVPELRGTGDAKLGKEFDARVIQVPSGDSVVVKVNKDEFRVSLASISAPRVLRGNKFEPFAFESREFVRKALIGKQVHVVVEYERELKSNAPANNNKAAAAAAEDDEEEPPRMFVSISQQKQNISVELVQRGFATVRNHGKDDARASNYEQLIQAEHSAASQGKGVHSKTKVSPHIISDLTILPPADKKKKGADKEAVAAPEAGADGEKKEKGGKKKGDKTAAATAESKDAKEDEGGHGGDRCKMALVPLRDKQVAAVVEYVFSGSRMKLYIPSINSLVAFSLAGIRVPQNPKPAKGESKESVTKDPLVDEALQFSKSRLLHTDVIVEIKSLSRGDVFVGDLFFANKQSLALQLVKAGLASVFGFGPDRKELIAAEQQAKSKHLKMWHDWDEAKEKEKEDKARAERAEATGTTGSQVSSKEGAELPIVVTDIVDPVKFYVNVTTDKALPTVQDFFKTFDAATTIAALAAPFKPAKGTIVAGLFAEDKQWYRVRIDAISKGDNYSVQFIDFGTCGVVHESNLCPLPANISSIPQLARPCVMAALRAPYAKSEYFDNSIAALDAVTSKKQLVGRVEATEANGVMHITLISTETTPSTNINAALVRAGHLRVNPKPMYRLKALAEELAKEEEVARLAHSNIWEYGDISDGEDD